MIENLVRKGIAFAPQGRRCPRRGEGAPVGADEGDHGGGIGCRRADTVPARGMPHP